MKDCDYIIKGILVIAVIILFVLYAKNNTNTSNQGEESRSDPAPARMPIAYINTDSLIYKYNFAKDLNEIILRKKENSHAIINQRMQQFRQEYLDFRQKSRSDAYVSKEREYEEEERLARKQQDLKEFVALMQDELDREISATNQQVRDTLIAGLKIYNSRKKYQVILSNRKGLINKDILSSDEIYDITDDVILFLNKKYEQDK